MSLLRKNFYLTIAVIALLSAAMHFRIFTTDIIGPHAWRQTQTVANIQYFTRNDFNILHPQTHYLINGSTSMRMEFPLMQWVIAATFRIFGEHIWLMRLLLFAVGILTIAGMYKLAISVLDSQPAGAIAAWAFCFSPMFYYYSMNPLPDLLALCCAVWGLEYFYSWKLAPRIRHLIFCIVLFAISTLCKLPYVLFYAVFAGWILQSWKEKKLSFKKILPVFLFAAVSLILPLVWYLTVMREWSPNAVTSGMLNNTMSVTEIASVLWGTLISALPEFLLNYATVPLFIVGLFWAFRRKNFFRRHAPLIMVSIALLCYFFFELNAITLIHDYYLLPFLPLLFLIATRGALRFLNGKPWMKSVLYFLLLLMPFTAFLRSNSRWDENDPGFNADLLKYKNELRTSTPPDSKIIIGNDPSGHIGLYYANREGWNFDVSSPLDSTRLRSWINQGADYLYSDSQETESDPTLRPFYGDTIAVIGSFRIIELKTPISAR